MIWAIAAAAAKIAKPQLKFIQFCVDIVVSNITLQQFA